MRPRNPEADARVEAVFDDNPWRALAFDPALPERTWAEVALARRRTSRLMEGTEAAAGPGAALAGHRASFEIVPALPSAQTRVLVEPHL